ncbi:hypothetical protein V2J09_021081 [Rumex salicifolius]
MVINFYGEDYEVEPYIMDPLPGIDDMDESEMREMEATTDSYLGAIVIANEKQDEESLQSAVNARLHLQSFVFKQLVAYLKNSLIIKSVMYVLCSFLCCLQIHLIALLSFNRRCSQCRCRIFLC